MSPSARPGTDASPKPHKEHNTLQSSVPAGTQLKGLNFYKDKTDPLAMEDHEYPDWLWGVLQEIKGTQTGSGAASCRFYP